MKYYTQLTMESQYVFDVVWGEPLKEDDSLVLFKRGKDWSILDVASGLTLKQGFKTKKAALEWYYKAVREDDLYLKIENARDTNRYRLHTTAMCAHRLLKEGDRCTYIDVKDSVILDLIIYSSTKDKWLVKDEWHQFEVSPDRLIKVSEVD